MSFLDRFTHGEWKPSKQPRSLNVVKANNWDVQAYKKVRLVREVDSLVEELEAMHDLEEAARLVQDLWMLGYKGFPQIRKKKELSRKVKVNKQIIDILRDLPDLDALQRYSGGDPALSLMAVEILAPHVKKLLEEAEPPPPPPPAPSQQDSDDSEDSEQQPQTPPPASQAPQPDDQQDSSDEDEQGQGQGQPGQPGEQGDDSEPGEQGQSGQGSPSDPDDDTDGDDAEVDEDGEGEGDPSDDEGDFDDEADDEGDFDDEADEDDEGDEDGDGEGDFDPEDWDDEQDAIDPAQAEVALAKALSEAKDTVRELRDAERSMGSEAGQWAANADPAERMSVLNRLKHMKKLVDLVGRFQRFALGQYATKITPSEHEMYGVKLGANIPRIMPHQFALLGNDKTKVEFYKRYANRELLEWKMRGKERAGKGPIVALVDKSDSMGWGERPMDWAVACVAGIRQIAEKEQRDMFVQFFDGNLSKTFAFPKGKASPPEVLELLSVAPSGGTVFMPPCNKAIEVISKAPEFDRADIVMITDGAGNTTPEWIAQFKADKERLGVRMFGVFIGSASDFKNYAGPSSALAQISDHLIPVQELTIDSAREMFREF